jgi:cobalt-precorrin-7 (C5)-methyltransferase
VGVSAVNPARIADAAPEEQHLEDPVVAVGVGPGDPSLVPRRNREAIADANVVVGFSTVTDLLADWAEGDVLSCGYDDQTEVLARFADRVADGADGAAALWGDPNVSGYQFLGRVEDALDRPVRILPGVSSVQVAAARARTPLEHTTFASLHRRGDVTADIDRLAADASERHLLVIPRPDDWMPPSIAESLVERGADPDLDALVLEDLTLPEQAIERTTLGDLATDETESAYSELTILAVRA